MKINQAISFTIKLVFIFIVALGCLGLESLNAGLLQWTGLIRIREEVLAVLKAQDTQWMVLACVAVYFVGFNWLVRPRTSSETAARICGLLLFAIAVLRYAWDYNSAAATTDTLMLCFGLTLFQGIAFWQWNESRKEKPFPVATVTIGIVLLILATSVFARGESAQVFSYRGLTRWSSWWQNPNTFGNLMAVAVVLAVGEILSLVARNASQQTKNLVGPTCWSARTRGSASLPGFLKAEIGQWVLIASCAAVAVACGIGLFKSYSRGAWLGAFGGLAYLLWSFLNREIREIHETQLVAANEHRDRKERKRFFCALCDLLWPFQEFSRSSCGSRLKTNWRPLSVVLLSVVLLTFWNLRQTEHVAARRMTSVANTKDFSWRNRVAAWEGALQMMTEKPLLGYGWNRPERIYDGFFRSPKLEEAMAIQMNDYFMLGTTLGVPALACFIAFVGLSLMLGPKRFDLITCHSSQVTLQVTRHTSLATACCAGAIVLLIGFWLDGGLFKLATGSLSWILLAVGSAEEVEG